MAIVEGYFVGENDREFFVTEEGGKVRYWDCPDMNIEYDPVTWAVIGKRIVVQTASIIAPSGANVEYAAIRKARMDQLHVDEDGRIWDSPARRVEYDFGSLEPKAPAVVQTKMVPVAPEAPVAPTAPAEPASQERSKKARIQELGAMPWGELRKMAPNPRVGISKAEVISTIIEAEFKVEEAA